jgi:hypothetical protein
MSAGRADAPLATTQEMTPRAAEFFAAYYGQGPRRSLRKLANDNGMSAAQLRQLFTWSSKYDWPGRIRAMAEAQLEEATELRRGIYLRALREYERRTDDSMIQAFHLNDLNSIYDRVKPSEPKSTTSVNVGIAVDVRKAAEAAAAELGVDVEVVLAETSRMVEEMT